MQALEYWKALTSDRAGFLESFIEGLRSSGVHFCLIGGQAVNAYVEPVVSLDLDVAVAAEDLEETERLLRSRYKVVRFPHSLNVSMAGSDLRAQIQTDPRYASFVAHAEPREVLGLVLPVASIEDVLQGKIWAVQDPGRRASKRQKDLADIARLIEVRPDLRNRVTPDVLARLI
jgi:hypothetical protein